jgi:predicted ABC-type ATPase
LSEEVVVLLVLKGYPEFNPDEWRAPDGRWAREDAPDTFHLTLGGAIQELQRPSEAIRASVKNYGTSGYMIVNSYLRGIRVPASPLNREKIEEHVANLDVYTKSYIITEPVVVYRAAGTNIKRLEMFDSLTPGDSVVDKGFMSTSVHADVISTFGDNSMRITLLPGVHVGALFLDDRSDEAEILLPRDTELKFVGKVQLFRNSYHYDFVLSPKVNKGYPEYNPDQSRDEHGRWVGGAGRPTNLLHQDDAEKIGSWTKQQYNTIRDNYLGTMYSMTLNRRLRNGESLGQTGDEVVVALDAFIAAHKTKRDGIVYRGFNSLVGDDLRIGRDILGGLKEGDLLVNAGYTSATPDVAHASGFGQLMEIAVPQGTPIGPGKAFWRAVDRIMFTPGYKEDELILPRGLRLRFDGTGRVRAGFGGWFKEDRDTYRFTVVGYGLTKGYPEYNPSQTRGPDGRWLGGEGGELRPGHEARDLLGSHLREKPTPSQRAFMRSLTPKQRAYIRDTNKRLSKLPHTDALVSEGGFKNPDGTWTADRQALHERIIELRLEDALERAKPAEGEDPQLIIMGGRPGSGKTTSLMESGFVPDMDKYLYVNADDLRGDNKQFKAGDADYGLPGYHGWNSSLYHEEASELASELEDRGRELGLNIIHDATLRSPDASTDLMDAFEEAGYRVSGLFVQTTPEIAATRAIGRAMSNSFGRYVPTYILGKGVNELAFDTVKDRMYQWKLYDNNGETSKLILSGGTRTAKGWVSSIMEEVRKIAFESGANPFCSGGVCGGYVWPRLGFELADENEVRKLAYEVDTRLLAAHGEGSLDKETVDYVRDVILKSGGPDLAFRLAHLNQELPNSALPLRFTHDRVRKSGSRLTLGKFLLLGTTARYRLPQEKFARLGERFLE